MGVYGLWDIVGSSARPVRLEALRNKRLAVDASIWIYQFLKAVRDKEGNQLKNSHIVGFLRRICKLLYFGIKPVFVFDGGVPTLKKDTIRKRKEKREGNKESVEQIAQKILAKQLQSFAEGKIESPRTANTKATRREIPTEELYFDTYYDDQVEGIEPLPVRDATPSTSPKKKDKEGRMFKGQDDYDLPNHGPIEVKETDNRVMASYEYDRLTKDINDDLDGLDLDNLDPQSKEFERLPLSTQYIALSHLRLRSRLRMGYTKEQLQILFPDPMEFSKFQIKMVQKRNFYTQKVMNVTGMDGDSKDDVISRRIASDKNRAYDLKRTGDGYALTISKQSGEGESSENPVFLGDINEYATKEGKSPIELYDSDDSNDIDWDDVEVVNEKPIEKKEEKKEKENVVVENPLFVQDTDEEGGAESSSHEESVEMEDVPLNTVTNKTEDDDEVMKKIKYLYEYSAKNNKKKTSDVVELPPEDEFDDDVDIDEYQEIQIKQMEDDELRQAIEKSKKEYFNILDEEKNGSTEKQSLENEAPIILSLSTLSKTLGLTDFSMQNNLLFGGSVNSNTAKEKKVEQKTEEDEKKIKRLLPLPDWFSSETNFKSKSLISGGTTVKPTTVNLTEDQKAGLVSYGEIEEYLSSDDDDNVEFIEVETEKPVIEIADEGATAGKTSMVEILDDDDNSPVAESGVVAVSRASAPGGNTGVGVQVTADEPRLDQNPGDGHDVVSDAIPDNTNKSEAPETDTKSRKTIVDLVNRGGAPKASTLGSKSKQTPHSVSDKDTDKKTNGGGGLNSNLDDNGEDEDEFSDDDDEVNLFLDMEEENIATDKFFNKLSGVSSEKANDGLWTFTDEAALQERLRKQKRDSDEVSTNMIIDIQDLLSRFGIPYITAPMEAEAQCAELELIGLVDGIITDDSDCLLFGGDKIYKNLFNEKTFVECYQDDDISEELGLNRTDMIELAILLGSDYTDGIKGVGKVMAMEILAEFHNLDNFRDWWVDYQNGKIETTKDTAVRKKIRKSLGKSLFLDSNFPNKLIYEAYLHPEVDHDKTEFKWGYPDVEKLTTFLMYYVGWNKEKIDEILSPVIKSMSKPQTTIEEFFPLESIQRRRQLDMSSRMKMATKRLMRRGGTVIKDDEEVEEVEKNSKRQKV